MLQMLWVEYKNFNYIFLRLDIMDFGIILIAIIVVAVGFGLYVKLANSM